VDHEVTIKALKRLKQTPHPRLSFVDAANIVLMERERLDTIFTFDSFYGGIAIQHAHTQKYLTRIP